MSFTCLTIFKYNSRKLRIRYNSYKALTSAKRLFNFAEYASDLWKMKPLKIQWYFWNYCERISFGSLNKCCLYTYRLQLFTNRSLYFPSNFKNVIDLKFFYLSVKGIVFSSQNNQSLLVYRLWLVGNRCL